MEDLRKSQDMAMNGITKNKFNDLPFFLSFSDFPTVEGWSSFHRTRGSGCGLELSAGLNQQTGFLTHVLPL
jgi:hypothetical protein